VFPRARLPLRRAAPPTGRPGAAADGHGAGPRTRAAAKTWLSQCSRYQARLRQMAGTVVQVPRAPRADLSAWWAVAVAGAARPLCLGAVFRQWCRWEPERQHGKSQSNSRCRALTLRLANPRKLLQGAPMRCPEKAGQTGEERHSREHGADEPADELSRGSLPRDRGEPVYNEPMTV